MPTRLLGEHSTSSQTNSRMRWSERQGLDVVASETEGGERGREVSLDVFCFLKQQLHSLDAGSLGGASLWGSSSEAGKHRG